MTKCRIICLKLKNYLLPTNHASRADHRYQYLTRAIRALNLCRKPWKKNLPHLSKMVSVGRQMLGLVLAIIGFLGSIIICALPKWIVSKDLRNVVPSQVVWEGLWMICVNDFKGQMKCRVYDSLLDLPQELQAARVMIVIAIIIGIFGVLLGSWAGNAPTL
ncbi:hypothetical protein WMY93_030910 [Mugilogobius chulae]|uniref:Claudin n=1 Tax=Mugilogobius chulae TaxID=88201 RepID=A0AAW0MFN6_9GOBI